MSTNPEFLWLGEKHKEALSVLKYAIMENKGVLALTGDVGTGKTTLINALLKSLGKDTITATIYDARLDVLDFFNTVAVAFKIEGSIEGKGQFILRFMDFLIKAYKRHQKVLLIIDEAQGINKDLLEEIRLLSNLEAEYTRLLNIFFVGQNEFIDILQKYENRALRQRVTVRYHIDPLTLNETAAYIRHRLEVGGTTAPIFDSGAIDEIYFFSGGFPRLINIMCDHALLTGYVREVQTINANLIRECRQELLVSKKSSREDFEFPAGNHQAIYREQIDSGSSDHPIASASLEEPMASDPPKEPMASGPSKQPAAPDLSREIMDYVTDSRFSEDEQDSFGPRYWTYKPTNPAKIQKKRFFRLRSVIIVLLIVGAGYFLYGKLHNKIASSVSMDRQHFKQYFSMNDKSKNETPSNTQVQPDASDIPKQVHSEKPEDSQFPASNSSNSGISGAAVPKKGNSFQLGPSKIYSQDAEASSLSKQSEETGSVDKVPVVRTDNADALDATPKSRLDEEASAETTRIKANSSGSAGPYPNPEAGAALGAKKPPEKIQGSDQTSGKIPATSSAVAAGPENPPAKAPVVISAPTIKKENVRVAASEPVQIRTEPKKNTKTTGKAVADSVAKKPETAALFEKFKKSLSKESAVSVTRRPSKPLTTIKEKKPAPVSASVQEMPKDQEASGRAKQETGERIASLGMEATTSGKAGTTHLTYIPLMTRLTSFLKKYCRTYEQKDLNKFSDFFALNAVEKGKPFKSWLPTYRRNFSRIDAIEYNIDLNRYATQEETGLIKIDGTFHIKARLEGRKEWLKSSGDISMILEADGNSFKVKELDY